MNRYRWVVVAAFAVLCVFVLVYLAVVPRITVDQFLSEIRADLPPGTDRTVVEDWLRQRGIATVPFVNRERQPIGLGGEVTGVYRLEIFSTVIRFEIGFDDKGKLRDVTAYQFMYAP